MNGMACVYHGIGGISISYAHKIPFLISMSLSIMGFVITKRVKNPFTGRIERYGEIIFPILGLYLHVTQYMLWPLQRYFNVIRPDPYCPGHEGYAFPSIEAFYTAALITFIVAYCVVWSVKQPWTRWVLFLLIFALPNLILIWYGHNEWWQVLVSMFVGVFTSVTFVIVLRYYISPSFPYMLNSWPLNWLGYYDTYCSLEHPERDQYYFFYVRQWQREYHKRSYPSSSSFWQHYGQRWQELEETPYLTTPKNVPIYKILDTK